MAIGNKARVALDELVFEAGELGAFEFMVEHENEGICLECGNLQSGVEPDASGYKCEACGQSRVMGLENAFLNYGV